LYAKHHAAFERAEQAVRTDLDELQGRFADPALALDTGPVQQTRKEHAALGVKYREALAGHWRAAEALAYRAVDRQVQGQDRPMNVAIKAMAEGTLATAALAVAKDQEAMAARTRGAALVNVGLLALGLILGYLLRRAIADRIQLGVEEAMAGMGRMAAGDFRKGLEVRTQDDLGRMAAHFNTLLARFQGLFSTLKDSSAKVASGSTELSHTASEVARAASEIAQLAEGQHHASERTAAAVVQFAASIREVGGHVKASEGRTSAMVQAAEDGARQGEATVRAMQVIRDATRQMVQAVGVIQSLARQTNLLALNAAIEAAKAGVHGVGFAVVAEEVRKLAEDSGGAAKRIGELIRQTESAMGEGTLTVEATAATLAGLRGHILQLASALQEIGSATEEQAHTSGEVEEQVQMTSMASERSAAASTELSHTVDEVNQTADYLARIADELAGTLSRFQIA